MPPGYRAFGFLGGLPPMIGGSDSATTTAWALLPARGGTMCAGTVNAAVAASIAIVGTALTIRIRVVTFTLLIPSLVANVSDDVFLRRPLGRPGSCQGVSDGSDGGSSTRISLWFGEMTQSQTTSAGSSRDCWPTGSFAMFVLRSVRGNASPVGHALTPTLQACHPVPSGSREAAATSGRRITARLHCWYASSQ